MKQFRTKYVNCMDMYHSYVGEQQSSVRSIQQIGRVVCGWVRGSLPLDIRSTAGIGSIHGIIKET